MPHPEGGAGGYRMVELGLHVILVAVKAEESVVDVPFREVVGSLLWIAN